MEINQPGSTTANVREETPGPASIWLTRIGRIVLLAVVVLAAVGLLGPRSNVVSASSDGWELATDYSVVLRAGQPAPLDLEITREGGFDGPISLSICGDYFSELDFQNWYPNPSSETRLDDSIVYEFDAPPVGTVLAVSLDARAAPGGLASKSDCTVSVLENGRPTATVEFTTWRLP